MDIYHELKKRNLVTSRRGFSRMLGAASNYASIRGDRGPSERASIRLFQRLWHDRHYLLAVMVAREVLWGAPRR